MAYLSDCSSSHPELFRGEDKQEEPDELLPPACSAWPSIGGAQGRRLSDPRLPGAFFLLNRECFTTEIGTVSPEDLSMSVFHLKL